MRELNGAIGNALAQAAAGRPFGLVSRSDSTLRGHFPLETDVLTETLGPFHATILFPYFEAGGLIVVGSHVAKTTEQLDRIERETELDMIELPVNELLSPNRAVTLAATADRINRALAAGRDLVVFTSRALLTGNDAADSQVIAQRVSAALVDVIASLMADAAINLVDVQRPARIIRVGREFKPTPHPVIR